MGTSRRAHRVAGRRGLTSWALLGGVSALALGAWVAAALRMGHREDLGLVVLVGVMLVGIAAGVVASTESWAATSDPYNRRPGVGPVGRGTDAGCGGGDVGGC
jgi:hypothetical protein